MNPSKSRHTCHSRHSAPAAHSISNEQPHGSAEEKSDDDTHNGNTGRVAEGADRAARGREGSHATERRGGTAAAGAAVGPDQQGLPLRHRRGKRLARRSVHGTLAASRVSLHVRARLHGRVPVLFGDRRWVQRPRRPPGQPRRDAGGGVTGATREAPGVQAAHGVDVSLGLLARHRFQSGLQRPGDGTAAARGERRIQLPP